MSESKNLIGDNLECKKCYQLFLLIIFLSFQEFIFYEIKIFISLGNSCVN